MLSAAVVIGALRVIDGKENKDKGQWSLVKRPHYIILGSNYDTF